ncbi:MAG: FAD-dependent oxidoreductase [Leptolyngbya foveolarum]|uniref:FAD-dependent oxidoreductase n=1 Tax=Leptolyngbya foveolarum TaxID=47253 RepID=A0A2W4W8N7_9CYAN|nr:MAG: FAD-dependent oxidoreductase [Leptolyngbya foveolarum]
MSIFYTDIAVIGAGPQALTLVTHLLQKKKKMRDRLNAGLAPGFRVFDPSGSWLAQWHRQFAAQEIPHLRSPAVHHPDCNPHTLLSFADKRQDELYSPYNRPGTELFQDFCETVIDRWHLRDQVTKAQVVGLTPQNGRFRLTLADGQRAIARRVVVATGAATAKMPDWTRQVCGDYPPERLCHAQSVYLPALPTLTGETVLIIGGGLTSAHLAMGALKRGARVLLMGRRPFKEKIFDAEPGWLGPKYLKGFDAEPDWHKRWHMIQQARDGGSLTPEALTRLRKLSRESRVSLYEQCQVTKAVWQGDHWQVQCDNLASHDCFAHQPIDRIWLATGTQLDITSHPILEEVLAQYPIEIVNGLPVLDEHLRWPGCDLFLMGPWAALQVGPVARNLFGAKLACDRIVPALTKSSLVRAA